MHEKHHEWNNNLHIDTSRFHIETYYLLSSYYVLGMFRVLGIEQLTEETKMHALMEGAFILAHSWYTVKSGFEPIFANSKVLLYEVMNKLTFCVDASLYEYELGKYGFIPDNWIHTQLRPNLKLQRSSFYL